MAQIDILKEVLDYSLRKFEHYVIGSNIYFSFNNERYAIAKLKKSEKRMNEIDGVSIIYISKLFGKIDQCDLCFKDVFYDSKRATINMDDKTDDYEWYQKQKPTVRDLNKLAEHIERYMNIIGDFGEVPSDYTGVTMLAMQSTLQSLAGQYSPLPGGDEVSSFNVLDAPSDEYKGVSCEDESPVIEEESDSEASKTEVVEEETAPSSGTAETIILGTSEPSVSDSGKTETEDVENAEEHLPSEFTEQEQEKAESLDANPVQAPRSPKKKLFNFFKGKEEKSTEASLILGNSVPRDLSSDSSEETNNFSSKPFEAWNIGERKDSDVVASLYKTEEKGIYSLVISGKGSMKNFKSAPWIMYTEQITSVEIENGITNIGNNAFKSFGLLKFVSLPDSVSKIGLSAFEFCSKLENIRLSQNLKTISDFAFAGTEKLKEVHLPDSVEGIYDYAFDFMDDFVVTCKDPKRLYLGAGISPSDFQKNTKDFSDFSVDNYMS